MVSEGEKKHLRFRGKEVRGKRLTEATGRLVAYDHSAYSAPKTVGELCWQAYTDAVGVTIAESEALNLWPPESSKVIAMFPTSSGYADNPAHVPQPTANKTRP